MYWRVVKTEAAARRSSQMEGRDHSNAANPKSLKSRGNVMRRTFLVLAVFWVSVASAFAQDVITLKNGMSVQATVQEIGENEVKFKKYDNSDGRVYTLNKYEIADIMYTNGSAEKFDVNVKRIDEKKMVKDFENRMIICGFIKRVVVNDFLPNSLKSPYGWTIVGVWFNYENRLVALRSDRNNWNEIIIPFEEIQTVTPYVEGVEQAIRGGVYKIIYVRQIRIVTRNVNTGTRSYTLNIYNRYPYKRIGSGQQGAFSSSADRRMFGLYNAIEDCVRTIMDEFRGIGLR